MSDRYRVDELDHVTCIYDTQWKAYAGLPESPTSHRVLAFATSDDARAWLTTMAGVKTCPMCGGSGQVNRGGKWKSCAQCSGTGKVPK